MQYNQQLPKYKSSIKLQLKWSYPKIVEHRWYMNFWQVQINCNSDECTLNQESILFYNASSTLQALTVNIAFYEPCFLWTSVFMNLFSWPFECLFMLIASGFMNFGFYEPKMLVPWGFIKADVDCIFIYIHI